MRDDLDCVLYIFEVRIVAKMTGDGYSHFSLFLHLLDFNISISENIAASPRTGP